MKTPYRIKTFLFTAISLVIISCQNGIKQSDGISTDLSENSSATIQSVEYVNERGVFTPVEMLLPVQYRKESTGYPQNIKNKDWYEFYKDEKTGDWKIGKAELLITYGRDECVGEDVMVIKAIHENTIMFFTPFEGMMEKPITTIEDKALFPERNLTFNFSGKEYSLSPMGNCKNNEGQIIPSVTIKEMSEDDLGDIQIDDYVLTISAPENVTYTIATIPQMISVKPKVIWAGDMNGDGLLDLVLNLSDFYESMHIFLFLSDKNDLQKPLKKAADLKVVNDC